jgi:ubiquinone/menaquinone biosynthesis C-methylase UbiE
MEQPSTLLFSRHWDVYQQVIANNYMRHEEMAAYFDESFGHIVAHKNIRVLDLGCGDAGQVAPVLKLKAIDQYTGYDMSEPALEIARANLKDLPAVKRFVHGQMEVLIRCEQEKFEVIHSSYAIHHLQDSDKKQLLADCYQGLTKGGILIVTDVFRRANQSRSEYIESYVEWMRETWPAIDAADKELIWAHVRQFDFPAAFNEIIAWSRKIGFEVTRQISPDKRHYMLLLKKN